MYVRKNFTFQSIIIFTGGHIIWLTAWAIAVVAIHSIFHDYWIDIPWLPISIIATAVAFYIGFKNNSSYDRMWEARKIWGGIVNSSRMWSTTMRAYISNQFRNEKLTKSELHSIHERLIYRHIAWLYTLRSQLLIPAPWEHIRQNVFVKKANEKRMKRFGIGLFEDEITELELRKYLKSDCDRMIGYQNTATQIIDMQSQDLKKLREQDIIDDFRHMELQKILNDFYTYQGQCERIKKFPLPRQYGSSSIIFIGIFIFLLPFGFIAEFHKLGEFGAWWSIPFTVLVGWIYVMMELIGDYSENPFEGLGNDIPMLSICRTIEIDLLEMLGETDLPPAIVTKNNVLM
jgi:ion channel-forming bestrophin family protein